MSVPEACTGRSAELVLVSGASKEYTAGIPQEVSDRGIVLSVEIHVSHPMQSLFYPWGTVIQLSEEREG